MCNCTSCSSTEATDYSLDQGRRKFMLDSLAAGGLAASLGMSGLARANAPAEANPVVKIGYLPITDATALLVAHANGYFEEEGLKVEAPTLIRGWSPLVEGFAAGRFNLVHLLKPIPLWMRYNNQFPVKIMAWAHTSGSAVVVGRRSQAKDFGDLGGSQVAVPYWYSVHNVLLQKALKQAGLKPVIKDQGATLAADEVNLLILPPPEMPPALAAGQIDAFTVAEPFNAAGELLAGGRMLRFTGDIWQNHPCCVICMNEQMVNQNPEWTQKAMNALVRAEAYAQANKESVAEMLSRDGKGYLPMPAKVVVRAMTHYGTEHYDDGMAIRHGAWSNGRIDFAPYPYPSATRFLVDAMRDTLVSGDNTFLGDLDADFVASDLVDDRFVKQALGKYPTAHVPGGNPDSLWDREEVFSL
ncbi:ABC transporter substrate-binding protein [uncultured Marinobacter sp.]|uniref:ABC transporter substrate-binding protein n=1 Tax=uncultured Marinobacter sp. TaxID=187379 RepID=UPI0030D7600E